MQGSVTEVPMVSAGPQHGGELADFVLAHGRSLLRLAYVLTGSRADAEDLLQDALTDAHRGWAKVAASAAPYAYVRRILLNRHTSRMRRASAGERPVDPAGLPVGSVAAPDERVVSDLALWQRLSALPPRMRQVLVLRYYEDLDDAAIADALAISPGTVRSTASRALAILREEES